MLRKINIPDFGSGSNQGPQQKIEKMDKHFQNTNGGNSPLMKSDLFQIENLIKKSKIFPTKTACKFNFTQFGLTGN